MARIATTASPFRCRWIAPGTEMHLERWPYAICMRSCNDERVVNEEECSQCACWEPRQSSARPTPRVRAGWGRVDSNVM